MSALSDALTAAQARAITALERAYLAGIVDGSQLLESLNALGATDVIEQGELLVCLNVLREYGATVGNGDRPARQSEPATEPQRGLIAKLADERGVVAPDLAGVTKTQASEIITSLQNGTYDAERWVVPF